MYILFVVLLLATIGALYYIFFYKTDYTFKFNGEKDVYLLINGSYRDPVIDILCNGKKCDEEVIIDGNIDSSKEGDYEITYSHKKMNDKATRMIHVSNFDEFFKIEYDSVNTLSTTVVNIKVDKTKVSKYVLPNGTIKDDNSQYEISENGEYTFIVFDNYNNKLEKKIVINNIIVNEPNPTPVVTPMPTQVPQVTPSPTPTPSQLEIHFINAGGYYDDAILIRSDRATIFMDGGRGSDAVVRYLNEVNVKKIDYVIGSHTEYDHIFAQAAIIENFQVDNLLYANSISSCGCRCDSTDVGAVRNAMRKKNVPETIPQIPSVLNIGDMKLYFIGPPSLGCNKNENSLIFILKFGNNTFMFPGDSDSRFNDVDKLLENAKAIGLSNIKVNVLKYPHHGNKFITDKSFEAIKPEIIMVPNVHAQDNPSKKMRDKIKNYGITMYRQSDSSTGNILLTSDGNKIEVKMDVVAKDYAK